jgi:DtxR family Mn-dependent transcriptional regulator
MYTQAEENYLKAIFKIAEREKKSVSTNAVAGFMKTSAASATDMLQRLAEKGMVNYEKYKGVFLTPLGNRIAIQLVRKHRLWEVFLSDKLKFAWHQVHDLAEMLEHIDSEELINRLDEFLQYPKFDPHGDPIPNAEGKFTLRSQWSVAELPAGSSGILIGVREHDTDFLEYLNDLKIRLGTQIKVVQKVSYDQSYRILTDGRFDHLVSSQVAANLLVKKQ